MGLAPTSGGRRRVDARSAITPRWVRCEPATKGPPLVAGPAWPFFFASAADGAHACSVVAIAGHAEPLDDLVQGGVVLFGAAIPLSRTPPSVTVRVWRNGARLA